MNTKRECIDGPLKGAVFYMEENRATSFIHKKDGTGRYLPVGDSSLKFEYWRKCNDNEVKEITDANEENRRNATEARGAQVPGEQRAPDRRSTRSLHTPV